MKPEDVMRAFDILDKMDFFQGQRAGRELWFEKPFEVQEQDIADFSQGISTVKKVIEDSLALLREKDAEIERLTINMNAYGLTAKNLAQEFEDYRADVQMEIAEARAEAITEFEERLEKSITPRANISSQGMLEAFVWCLVVVRNIAKEMKGI
jgi:hypothetical protein